MSLLEHEALPVLLRHPAVLEQQAIVCKLLAASKAMQSLIRDQCRGQVVVSFIMPNHPDSEGTAIQQSKRQLQCFAEWLGCHAHLLKQLEVGLMPPVNDEAFHNSRGCITRTVPDHKGRAEAAVAAALQQAVSAAGPLVLQAFRLLHGRSSSVCILQHVNTTLTSLHLEVGKTNLHLHPNQRLQGRVVLPSLRQTTPILQRLTALTSLTIICPQAHKLAPALPSLTELRDLNMAYLDVRRIAVLGQLTSKLISLHFNVLERWEVYYDDKDDSDAETGQQQPAPAAAEIEGAGGQQQPVAAWGPASWHCQIQPAEGSEQPTLQLRQLGSLQQLISHTYKLQPQDVLPASLQVLELGHCNCVQPLLQLQQLQELRVHKDVHLTASDLLHIGSKLKCLRSVGLAYQDLGAADEAAAAWSKVPIASLMLDLGAAALEGKLLYQIGQLSCLTRLCFWGVGVVDSVVAVSPAVLGGLLQQLSSLQELQLNSLRVEGASAEGAAAAAAEGSQTLARSRRASAAHGSCKGAASDADSDEMMPLIAAIAAVPQLSSLTLSDVGCSSGEWLNSHDLAPLAAATQLTCLHIFMSWLDDGGVAALVKSLRGLRRLGLDHCARVTSAAAQQVVQELSKLTWFSVWGTQVRDRGHLVRHGLELVGV